MKVFDAHAVCINGTVYVGGGLSQTSSEEAKLFSYAPGVRKEDIWTEYSTPTFCYALAGYNSKLQLVGGQIKESGDLTNEIYTMVDPILHTPMMSTLTDPLAADIKELDPILPPMKSTLTDPLAADIKELDPILPPTKSTLTNPSNADIELFKPILPPMKSTLTDPLAAGIESVLVVTGSINGIEFPLEVFKDDQWSSIQPCTLERKFVKSALHRHMWYLMNDIGSVFCISIHSLLSEEHPSPWEQIPNTPYCHSAIVFFGGHLLSIGGGDTNNYKSAIHAFFYETTSWEHVGDLPVPLKNSTVVVTQAAELIVAGGIDEETCPSDQVFRLRLKGVIVLVQCNLIAIL